MNFQNDAQKATYENIDTWITEIFGEFVWRDKEDPVFGVNKGSAKAIVGIWPAPFDDADTVITVFSHVVREVETTPDLMHYLLHENAKLVLAGFQINDDGTIVVKHSILGSTCDKAELKASIMSVLFTADKYDDQIVSRWGGQTSQQTAEAARA